MTKFKRFNKRGPVTSKKIIVDGIQFQSLLESYMYTLLRDNNIDADYEGETFKVIDGFHLVNE